MTLGVRSPRQQLLERVVRSLRYGAKIRGKPVPEQAEAERQARVIIAAFALVRAAAEKRMGEERKG